jgi:3-hydroxyacyl-CoA dehydrogenase/3-hydroxy-2-methylbutyryl-CoA dehydrogenase
MDPRGRTALVSGGTSGLGLAAARLLLARGANVAVLGLGPVDEIASSLGPDVLSVPTDITDPAAVEAAVARVVERFGALHINVNTAGIMVPCTLLDAGDKPNSVDVLRQMFDVNVVGTLSVIGHSVAAMLQNPIEDGERGVVVNTSSIAAFDGAAGQAAYASTKAGLLALALPMARELAGRGIRFNTVAPGGFDTPMNSSLPTEFVAQVSRQIPNPQRLGQSDEYASMTLALIENAYANAAVIRLDGGFRMTGS